MNAIDIGPWQLAVGYILLIFPLAIMLWYRIGIVGTLLVSVVRMTVQLLLVGLYLQFIFQYNNILLNTAWLLVMIVVADVSIARRCGLRLRRFCLPMFAALVAGTATPLLVFLGVILRRPNLMDAQYAIPIGGMILGNCLRADIIGLKGFYQSIRDREKVFLNSLAQGARLSEAVRPFIRDACKLALTPTIATMATIGLVSLPGMMTGVILGGADPMTAIKYQIAIMIAIFSGTAITVWLAIHLSIKATFTHYGILDKTIFSGK